jgi:hypothetical protein
LRSGPAESPMIGCCSPCGFAGMAYTGEAVHVSEVS